MIVILKQETPNEKRDQLVDWLKKQGFGVDVSEGEYQTVLGLIGDTARLDAELIETLGFVDSVKRVTKPPKRDVEEMTVGVVGLGLIGGSLAKAYHAAGARVLAWNRSESTLDFAIISEAVDGKLTSENIGECDLVLLSIYPQGSIDYLRSVAPYIGRKPLVVDCCGTKRDVCAACFPLAEEFGFTFVGGHPMAGTHFSGFQAAREDMFRGAPMVLVPKDGDDIALLERAKKLLQPAGFGYFSVTTPEKHDRMIAFTSQMAHVVSNVYIKSPTAGSHKGFSAGSYRDMTRVAWLNPG
ncbi:MAG: prephenate dehydrogenase/arogenate dehydrogenase family protein, partial [Oscillospiraceae bacterium]|nr:prephenate dehydrogenase/arogenate dehydrogenase family protein [Oscillospiraceae bacterium]